MGKCVSRQSTCPTSPAHHQSVLTIALSQQDLRHAHKIWQQLTASNEYIATTTGPTDEPSFYYHISRNTAQSETEEETETEAEAEAETETDREVESEVDEEQEEQDLKEAAVLRIESVYNHLDAHVSAENVIGSSLTGCNNEDFATCQQFLLQELAQTLAECQVKCRSPEFVVDNTSSSIASSEITATTTETKTTAITATTTAESKIQLQPPYEERGKRGKWRDKRYGGGGSPEKRVPQQPTCNMDECDNLVVVTLTAHEDNATNEHDTNNDNDNQRPQAEIQIHLQHKENAIEIDDNATLEQEDEEEQQQQDTTVDEDAAVDAEVEAVIMGQTESKKHGGKCHRRNNGNNGNHSGHQLESKEDLQQQQQQQQQLHTKGTAMSFGFRKKLNGTPKKFKKLLEGGATHSTSQTDTKDDNGNATTNTTTTNTMTTTTAAATPVQFEKVGVAVAQKTANRTGAANKRFGYRGNVPRPASASLTTSSEDAVETAANAQNNNSASNNNNSGNNNNHSNNNNNNNNNGNGNVLVSNLKRRSKSAHAGRTVDGEPKIAQPKTLTFNLNQNTTIEYQRRQFFGEFADEASATAAATSRQQRYNYNNLANMHANVIVRPTPRAAPASFAKFTLQTVSLPRPEYPVAISLTATTPTTPSSSVQSPLPTHATGARAKDVAATTRQHPLTSIHVQPTRQLDQKSVKQLTNNTTRRGFSGSREISADSGIASMEMALDSGSSSGGSDRSKRSRSRPRNLQMVMSGRHTFEVRDVDDPPSSESSSCVETLALPKLPTDNSQTTPLPLVGLVRSNTVLSRENYERRQIAAGQDQAGNSMQTPGTPPKPKANGSDDSESVDEEKLYLDSSTSEKSAKQQSNSLSSSMSWRCQAGESLAARDCSSMSITSTSADTQTQPAKANAKEEDMSFSLDDISLNNTDMDMPFSTISSLTEPAAKPSFLAGQDHLLNMHTVDNREVVATVRLPSERPRSFNNALNESKFAELALANSSCLLLDDETSPTDSLVSSTEESEEAGGKLKKHKLNAELQQKDIEVDIDDISPVLELELDPGSRSPNSPGTPTHASHSLSLGSDCGNLIDDEIADQPALLCNSEAHELATDTPTLMETHTHTQTGSLRSLKSQSKARTALQQAIELSLRTPAAVRRAVLESAESLDTLSPCESICSDDLMMDFDMNSSVDSIDRTMSMRSRSGSDLHKLGTEIDPEQAETEAELLSQLECKGSDVMKELNSLLRVRMQRTTSSPRERIRPTIVS
ncbi:hypothetical protein ACLKA6_010994 [Drosophila palustris]